MAVLSILVTLALLLFGLLSLASPWASEEDVITLPDGHTGPGAPPARIGQQICRGRRRLLSEAPSPA